MEVKYSYSKIQLNAAVNFIADHNEWFLGKHDYIRECMLDTMQEIAKQFPECKSCGSMGYLIMADTLSNESIDHDDNHIAFDISIDPSVTLDAWEDDDIMDTIIEIK